MTLYQSRASTTLADNTTKTLDLTVPQGKKWKIHAIMMHNGDNVTRNLTAKVVDTSGNTLMNLATYDAGAGAEVTLIPYLSNAETPYPGAVTILIKGGNKLRLIWVAGGASSGGTAYYCITYEEVPE